MANCTQYMHHRYKLKLQVCSYTVCGQQDYHSVVTGVILRHNTPVGVRLFCSKIYRLCYARMLQTLFDYALGVSLLCSCSKLNNY